MGFWDGSGISWTIRKQSAPRSRQMTTPTPHHSVLTGRILFLTPNQQRQSTEGRLAQLGGKTAAQATSIQALFDVDSAGARSGCNYAVHSCMDAC